MAELTDERLAKDALEQVASDIHCCLCAIGHDDADMTDADIIERLLCLRDDPNGGVPAIRAAIERLEALAYRCEAHQGDVAEGKCVCCEAVEVARLQAIMDRLTDKRLVDEVAGDCHDSLHDDRSCPTCRARGDGIEDYRERVLGSTEAAREKIDG